MDNMEFTEKEIALLTSLEVWEGDVPVCSISDLV
jgi:hypothetical protein